MNLDEVVRLVPWAQHTRAQFAGHEDGHWLVEIDVADPLSGGFRRLRLEFGGVVQARLNHDDDRKLRRGQAVYAALQGAWLQSFEQAYVAEFGPKLVAVIRNVRHFVVHGQDLTVGLLARTVIATFV